MAGGNTSTFLFIGLFVILAVALGAIIYKNSKAGVSMSDVVADGGFDRSKIISTDKKVDPTTGDITVTQTDSNGKKLVTKTDAAGNTKASVLDANGEALSEGEKSALEKFKDEAPKMAEMLGLSIGRDLALMFGASLIATASREIAQSGVRTGLRETAKIVAAQGSDVAQKFLGYVGKEGCEEAMRLAAKSSAAEAGRLAAKETLDAAAKEASSKLTQEAGEDAAKFAARKAAAELAAREAQKAAAEAVAEKAVEKEMARIAQRKADQALLKSGGDAALKAVCKDTAEFAARKAATKTAETAAEKATVRAVEKAAAKGGVIAAKEVAKGATAAAMAGTRLATMASCGPLGAVLMAVDVVSLALDLACCGGYCNVVEAGKYEKMRDDFKGQIQAALDDTNKQLAEEGGEPVAWPVTMGPIDKLDEATLNEKMRTKVLAIMNNPDDPIMVPIFTQLKAEIAAGRIKNAAGINQFISTNVDNKALIEAAKLKLCPELGGKIIDDKWCSWATKASCEGSFKWPIGETNKNDHYVTWDEAKQLCFKDPLSGLMRGICEGTRGKETDAGFPWDPVKNICTITKDYCLGKSMQWDEGGNKCSLSKGQEAAEMLFGTTMVRGLNQLMSADQYEKCPPGSRPAGEIAALAAAGMALGAAAACVASVGVACAAAVSATVVGATYLGQTMCATDKCPDGQARQSGLCYPECKKATPEEKAQGWNDFTAKAADTPGAQGVMIQGMCYRCPPGYYKSSPGICQRQTKTTLGKIAKCPPGFTDSGLFCNVKTNNIGIGKPMKTHGGGCHTSCPKGLCKTHCDPIKTDCDFEDRQKIDGLCYKKCKDGEIHVPGMPYLCRKSGGLLVQEKMKMGVCDPDKDRVGAQCFKKCSDYGPGWVRTVEGTCAAKQWGGVDVILTAGKKELSYSREPLGISYKVFPKKRKIPLGKGPHGC